MILKYLCTTISQKSDESRKKYRQNKSNFGSENNFVNCEQLFLNELVNCKKYIYLGHIPTKMSTLGEKGSKHSIDLRKIVPFSFVENRKEIFCANVFRK